MDQLATLKLWLPNTSYPDELLQSALDRAKLGILELRFPFGYPEGQELEPQFLGLQVEWALELIAKIGIEGQSGHSENGVSRSFESAGVSKSLMRRVVPVAKFLGGEDE